MSTTLDINAVRIVAADGSDTNTGHEAYAIAGCSTWQEAADQLAAELGTTISIYVEDGSAGNYPANLLAVAL